jgi:Transglycosylase SLT domain
MKKTIIFLVILALMLLLGVSCDQTHVRQAQTPVIAGDSELDRELRQVMEKGINLEERKRQVPAIAAAFARYAVPERARWLAALCYLKTLGTPFMPMDLAEIALAETGGHGLSAKATSPKGALGVWQLMPYRAKSHGYSPEEMGNDEKCADAAVRELASKLEMAKGNLVKAKKFYCGAGPDADAYEVKRRQFRKEILEELNKGGGRQAELRRFEKEFPS